MKRAVLLSRFFGAGVLLVFAIPIHAGSEPDHGQSVYVQTCAACHGADGAGAMPGVPDLTVAGGPLAQPAAVLEERTRMGFQSPGSPLPMPPRGGNPALTDEDIRAVVRYLKTKLAGSPK